MNGKDDKMREFKELNTDNKKAIIKYMEFLRTKQKAKRGKGDDTKHSS